jgi:hypothetical protein
MGTLRNFGQKIFFQPTYQECSGSLPEHENDFQTNFGLVDFEKDATVGARRASNICEPKYALLA